MLGGMPGAGKTTVGRILAQRLGRVFQDGDDGIAEMAGISVAEIFRIEGEDGIPPVGEALLPLGDIAAVCRVGGWRRRSHG